uniref:(northern house mosquito) hypothetical protein n=1 Tax=Culex pipiens TaxID=7175 RepID=A0A8D8J2E4_CULPI
MISSSRLWMQLAGSCIVLALYHVVSIGCNSSDEEEQPTTIATLDDGEDEESGRAIADYYAQMWYRTWQFPLITTMSYTTMLAFLFFSFGTSALQGLGYYKSAPENEQPIVIDGHIESYGNPFNKFWG